MKPSLLALALALPLAACTIAPPTVDEKVAIDAEARAALNELIEEEPAVADQIHNALALAIFPDIGKGGAIIGMAYGKGVLYEQGQVVGYCDLTQGSLGFQLGGQGFTEIVCIQTPDAIEHFRSGVYSLNANAGAVAAALGASTGGAYSDAVVVIIGDETGLMFEATIGVQEFRFEGLDPEG